MVFHEYIKYSLRFVATSRFMERAAPVEKEDNKITVRGAYDESAGTMGSSL